LRRTANVTDSSTPVGPLGQPVGSIPTCPEQFWRLNLPNCVAICPIGDCVQHSMLVRVEQASHISPATIEGLPIWSASGLLSNKPGIAVADLKLRFLSSNCSPGEARASSQFSGSRFRPPKLPAFNPIARGRPWVAGNYLGASYTRTDRIQESLEPE
jgi:hypothetical protein